MSSKLTTAVLPKLSYALNELEPFLIKEVVEIHYTKHHQKYVDEYNKWSSILSDAFANGDLHKVQKATDMVTFNAGGHYAHSLYWENLIPANRGGGVPCSGDSQFSKHLASTFGSVDNFISEFNTVCMGIQGSGWAWLAYEPKTKQLSICHTEKHDSVEQKGKIPLLTVDVWEHAYYLQYKNVKADYFGNVWKIMNWKVVEERYLKACSN